MCGPRGNQLVYVSQIHNMIILLCFPFGRENSFLSLTCNMWDSYVQCSTFSFLLSDKKNSELEKYFPSFSLKILCENVRVVLETFVLYAAEIFNGQSFD